MAFDIQKVQSDFPILQTKVNGHRLVYLDSAATTLKPNAVVAAMEDHYRWKASNVHRGIHYLSDQATTQFENARERVRKFINAAEGEVVFTHGTTESVNIVALGLAASGLKSGDEILLTEMEHHSNLVPWQMAAQRAGATVRFVPVNSSGELELAQLSQYLTSRTKIFAFTAVSNTLGSVNPIRHLVQEAKKVGALTLVDAAQAVSTMRVDVQEWGCDFLAFSGHKLFGPTGIGVLFGKKALLDSLPPLMGGGSMIQSVTTEGTTYLDAPMRFEAGTPHIAGAIGLGAAIDYFESLGIQQVQNHEAGLAALAQEELGKIQGLEIYAAKSPRVAILSFGIQGAHHQDVGSLINQEGVAIRTGHHCTQPLMKKLGVTGTCRASFSIYSCEEDVVRLRDSLIKAKRMLG